MIAVYQAWVKLAKVHPIHAETRGFNLDEYWPIEKKFPQSFYHFMEKHWRQPLQLSADRFRVPHGPNSLPEVEGYCQDWEREIQESGGVDLQLLGIGANGHIGFNEPSSAPNSRTRLVALTEQTRARAGFQNDTAPHQALTAGIGTILESKCIHILAFGKDKADAIHSALEKTPHTSCPASFLQSHPDVTWHLDADAASALKRNGRPPK